jgi:hypothetical protein
MGQIIQTARVAALGGPLFIGADERRHGDGTSA